ncbi:chaperonin CPN60-like 2, mitochondrial [Lathyrus oleraceus]|nr:chaperonin CPN60-like 2, mitochondrial [Pisum sativum]
MVKDVLASPVSTVASESTFSTGGRVLDTYRSLLTPEMAEALICAQDWLKPTLSQFKDLNINEEFKLSATIVSEFGGPSTSGSTSGDGSDAVGNGNEPVAVCFLESFVKMTLFWATDYFDDGCGFCIFSFDLLISMYDALLLDRFLDILQDLHGEDIRQTVQDCYELSAEYEGEHKPEKLEELGNMLTGLDVGDSIVIAKSFSHMLNLANLAEEVQIAYRRRIKLLKKESECGSGFNYSSYAAGSSIFAAKAWKVITEEHGIALNKVRPEMLGTAKKITVTIDDTIVLHGGGDKKFIEDRCVHLREAMERSSATFDKEKAQERLSKLSGGVAVFKVGGASEAEVGERKDRVTNALNAIRAAVEEGIVPGGRVALLYASKVLENLETKNEDERRGVQIIQYALKAPTFTIAANAGFDGSLIDNKLLEQDNLNLGFDAAKGTYVDMVKAGIVDPVKVVRTTLVDAASVALLLMTTETSIVENMSDKNKPPQRVADMDDLDY